jgi:hypothetical protein
MRAYDYNQEFDACQFAFSGDSKTIQALLKVLPYDLCTRYSNITNPINIASFSGDYPDLVRIKLIVSMKDSNNQPLPVGDGAWLHARLKDVRKFAQDTTFLKNAKVKLFDSDGGPLDINKEPWYRRQTFASAVGAITDDVGSTSPPLNESHPPQTEQASRGITLAAKPEGGLSDTKHSTAALKERVKALQRSQAVEISYVPRGSQESFTVEGLFLEYDELLGLAKFQSGNEYRVFTFEGNWGDRLLAIEVPGGFNN